MAKRGKALADSQLSTQQEKFLLWMLEQEPRERHLQSDLYAIKSELREHLYSDNLWMFEPNPEGNLHVKAVAQITYTPRDIDWNPTRFLGRAPTESESSSINRTVRLLEGRRLISRSRGIVRFTKEGRLAAEARQNFGRFEVHVLLVKDRLAESLKRIKALEVAHQIIFREYRQAVADWEKYHEAHGRGYEGPDDIDKGLERHKKELGKVKDVLFIYQREERERFLKRYKNFEKIIISIN